MYTTMICLTGLAITQNCCWCPYSLDTNDSKFARGDHDYQLGDEFFTYLKDSFEYTLTRKAEPSRR